MKYYCADTCGVRAAITGPGDRVEPSTLLTTCMCTEPMSMPFEMQASQQINRPRHRTGAPHSVPSPRTPPAVNAPRWQAHFCCRLQLHVSRPLLLVGETYSSLIRLKAGFSKRPAFTSSSMASSN